MYRAIPVGNRACAERVRQRNLDLHRQKLRDMRPTVDTSVPASAQMDHVRQNLKREQLLEDRYHEIDRENRILLQKMSDMMKHPGHGHDRAARTGPVSLTRDARKVELMRITQENSYILRRIQQVEPTYNHVAWEDSYQRSFTYLKNHCEYPPVLMRRKPARSSSLTPLQIKDSKDSKDARSSKDAATLARSASSTPGSKPSTEGMRYVLKEGTQLGGELFFVEMATDGRTLAISAYDSEQKRVMELLVSERNHRKLYREHHGDYSAIAAKLRVDGDKLSLNVPAD